MDIVSSENKDNISILFYCPTVYDTTALNLKFIITINNLLNETVVIKSHKWQ